MVQAILEGRKTQTRRVVKHELDNRGVRSTNNFFEDWHGKEVKCELGQVGDVLWVKETWAKRATPDNEWNTKWVYCYKADNDRLDENKRWQPSVLMPKEACRIFLKITHIWVQRLQEISEDDELTAEFTQRIADYGHTRNKLYINPDTLSSDIDLNWSFESLWTSINGQDSWEANPWVWVIEFERIAKPNEE
jgi:hypothetical protein